jgi:hypothetical protein
MAQQDLGPSVGQADEDNGLVGLAQRPLGQQHAPCPFFFCGADVTVSNRRRAEKFSKRTVSL